MDSEADRLAALIAAGAEEFDTGHSEMLWAVFDIPSITSDGVLIPVRSRRPVLTCRTSDAALHKLIKQSPVTREADGSVYLVRDLEPDGTGITEVWLGA